MTVAATNAANKQTLSCIFISKVPSVFNCELIAYYIDTYLMYLSKGLNSVEIFVD